MNDIRWRQRFDSYRRALRMLQRIVNEGKDSEVQRLAIVQSFKIVNELGWNLMKDYIDFQRLHVQNFPKQIIREAFKRALITDGQTWLEALEYRNKTSHTYIKEVANDLANAITHRFLPIFNELEKTFTVHYDQAD